MILRRIRRRLGDVRRRRHAVRKAALREPLLRARPLQPTLPFPSMTLDFERSPTTGLGRSQWRDIGLWILDNALQYSDELNGPIHFPPVPSAPLPELAPGGGLVGLQEQDMEAQTRLLMLASFLLAQEPGLTLRGRPVADYLRERLLLGVTPTSPEYFGPGDPAAPHQSIVEAAAIIVALSVARAPLWEAYSDAERGAVLSWLERIGQNPVVNNNWRWFGVLIHAFLEQEGGRFDRAKVEEHFDAIESFHSGDGWFKDGSRYDYYSGWTFHFYPLVWLGMDSHDPLGYRASLPGRNDAFLEGYAHLFSRVGESPMWGRSTSYRNGASCPFPAAFLRDPAPNIDPGFARMLCSGNLVQFVRNPDFMDHGMVPLGFHGTQPDVVDSYSSVSSPYWCLKPFIGLVLPEHAAYWQAVEASGFWASPPQKVELGETGMWVTHDDQTGHTQLFAPGNGPADDPRYNQPYFGTAEARYHGPTRPPFGDV